MRCKNGYAQTGRTLAYGFAIPSLRSLRGRRPLQRLRDAAMFGRKGIVPRGASGDLPPTALAERRTVLWVIAQTCRGRPPGRPAIPNTQTGFVQTRRAVVLARAKRDASTSLLLRESACLAAAAIRDAQTVSAQACPRPGDYSSASHPFGTFPHKGRLTASLLFINRR